MKRQMALNPITQRLTQYFLNAFTYARVTQQYTTKLIVHRPVSLRLEHRVRALNGPIVSD